MRELDLLLLRYLDEFYPGADQAEQQAFRYLLTIPDPDILALLTGKIEAGNRELGHVIERLLEVN